MISLWLALIQHAALTGAAAPQSNVWCFIIISDAMGLLL
jgi:hypothetical protein